MSEKSISDTLATAKALFGAGCFNDGCIYIDELARRLREAEAEREALAESFRGICEQRDQLKARAEAAEAVVGSALSDIAAERKRQVSAEGWSVEHDDEHTGGELARAAACYADPQVKPYRWPWSPKWWKPGVRRRDLVKAGALIVAEIERLDRLAARRPADSEVGRG